MSISSRVEPISEAEQNLSCVYPCSAFLGEAPCWIPSSKSLLWVDILSPSVHLTSINEGITRNMPLNELVGVVVPRRRGGFVAATQSGFRALDVQTGEMATLVSPSDISGRRFNDGKCDPAGRFWAGTISLDATPDKGTLYRLDVDGSLRLMDSGFHVTNGMGWSPDAKRFYLTDSGRRVIYVYDFDLDTGQIHNRRLFIDFSTFEGTPDGLAIDSEGALWCALWDGWSLQKFAADGRHIKTVAMPVPRPTSCAFGGDDLKTLYITSARIRLSSTQLAAAPLSGSVFALKTDVAGTPVNDYWG
jgi:sugar lactone lactonase YvrE